MKKAIRKIKDSLTHNVGIKIVAVIVAALIWLIVINMTDPEKTIVIYNVPVEVTHEEVISDMDMVYEVTSNKFVNITVSGKRSVVSKLSVDDFKAIASLKELSKVNSIPIEIMAKQGSVARRITIEKQSVQTLLVEVEEIKKDSFDIEVEYSGSAASGFVPGKYTLSKNRVMITAPSSILKNIDRVVAQCELEGNRSDFTNKCKLVLYDSEGNVIKSKHLTMSSKQVSVTVKIDREKEVPVELGDIGSPADGYEVKSTTLSQEQVKLVGDSAILDSIDKILIYDDIDISKAKKKYTKTIDLTKYIPEDVTINGEPSVKIEIEISPLATKTITVKASDVKILNEGDFKATVLKDIKITIQGESNVISNVTSKQIGASIHVDNLKEGKHSVPVDFEVPDGVAIIDNVSAQVRIK